VKTIACLDQLRGYTNAIAGLTDGTFEYVCNIQQLADLSEIFALPLERE